MTARKRKYSYRRAVSDERKKAEHRGEGRGADYKPWIRAQEFNQNQGTSYIIPDPYTGRSVHLLSTGEMMAWHLLRYDKNVTDIREQYPLDLETTEAICEKNGLRHPSVNSRTGYHSSIMTSDFLVDFRDGSEKVYSVKYNDSYLTDSSIARNLLIEKIYWNMKEIPFIILTREQLDKKKMLVENLQQIFYFASIDNVFDVYSYARYLIANHILPVNMEDKIIDVNSLVAENQFITQNYEKFRKEHQKDE